MWERIIKAQVAEIKRLGGKVMLIGECGHASRSAKEGMQNFIPPEERVPVVNIMELAHESFIAGKLRLKANVIEERTTYHDPCNIARKGWIVEQPRVLLRHICKDFVEMTPRGRGQLLLRRRRRHGLHRRDQGLPHAHRRQDQGRADQGHRRQLRGDPLRQLQEAGGASC